MNLHNKIQKVSVKSQIADGNQDTVSAFVSAGEQEWFYFNEDQLEFTFFPVAYQITPCAVTLSVTDGYQSVTKSISIQLSNQAPACGALPEKNIRVGSEFVFNLRQTMDACNDPDGDAITFVVTKI